MIRIISISNAHVWDNVEMPDKEFSNLIDLLMLSKYSHTVKFMRNEIVSIRFI